jgi:hypothetical protein
MINYVTDNKTPKIYQHVNAHIKTFLSYAKEMKYVTRELNRMLKIEQSQCKSLSLVLTIIKGD